MGTVEDGTRNDILSRLEGGDAIDCCGLKPRLPMHLHSTMRK